MTHSFVRVTAVSMLVVALVASCTPSTSPSADAAMALTDAPPAVQGMDVPVGDVADSSLNAPDRPEVRAADGADVIDAAIEASVADAPTSDTPLAMAADAAPGTPDAGFIDASMDVSDVAIVLDATPDVEGLGDAALPLDYAPTGNVVVASGVHRLRSLRIARGVTIRTTSPGVLEFIVEGEVTVDGVINLMGGTGGDGVCNRGPDGDCGGCGGGLGGRTGVPSLGLYESGPWGGIGASSYVCPGGHIPAAPGAGLAGGSPGESRAQFSGLGCSGVPSASCQRSPGGVAGGAPYDGEPGDRSDTCQTCTWNGIFITAGALSGGGGGSIGQAARDDLAVRETFAAGSGGGGGGGEFYGGGGGGGGGALRITSGVRITLGATAWLDVSGGPGTNGGGGGSGGVIFLSAPALEVSAGATLRAVGAAQSAGGFSGTIGGAGGLGRIRIAADPSRCVLAGSFSPSLVNGCAVTPGSGTPGRVYVSAWPP